LCCGIMMCTYVSFDPVSPAVLSTVFAPGAIDQFWYVVTQPAGLRQVQGGAYWPGPLLLQLPPPPELMLRRGADPPMQLPSQLNQPPPRPPPCPMEARLAALLSAAAGSSGWAGLMSTVSRPRCTSRYSGVDATTSPSTSVTVRWSRGSNTSARTWQARVGVGEGVSGRKGAGGGVGGCGAGCCSQVAP
jgi:hypothetical protein